MTKFAKVTIIDAISLEVDMGKFFEQIGVLILLAMLGFVTFGIIAVLFWQFLTNEPSPFG